MPVRVDTIVGRHHQERVSKRFSLWREEKVIGSAGRTESKKLSLTPVQLQLLSVGHVCVYIYL